MTIIDAGIIGMDIEVHHDHVIFNQKIKLLKPTATSSTQWEDFWLRTDQHYGKNELYERDGIEAVQL